MHRFVISLQNVEKSDIGIVGSAAADLGDLTQSGFPIPRGFVITTDAYFAFLHQNNLIYKINDILSSANFARPDSLGQIAQHIKKLIMHGDFSNELVSTINNAYLTISGNLKTVPVSLTTEKVLFSEIIGEANLILKIKESWALLFSPHALIERHAKKLDHFRIGAALVVSQTIETDVSGVMLTANPVNNDPSKIIIEVKGVNEHHEVQKSDLRIFNQAISTKKALLNNEQIVELATLAKKLEKLLFFNQEIYWAITKKGVVFLRHKILPLSHAGIDGQMSLSPAKQKLVAKGIGVSQGIATGITKIVKTANDIQRIILGDIVVVSEVKNAYLPALKKASALIAEEHGRTSPSALAARSLGIPAIVGVEKITTLLTNRQIITVNGKNGEIYTSSILAAQQKTATRLFLHLNQEKTIEKPTPEIQGVLFNHNQKKFDKQFTEHIKTLCTTFHPNPVLYRLSDFDETHPQRLGFRGAYRLIAQKDLLQKELALLRTLREKENIKNLWALVPFIRSVNELFAIKEMIKQARLTRGTSFKLWMSVTTAANVINLENFINLGIDGISINLDELTTFLIGVDETISDVSRIFDPLDAAVLWALEKSIKTAQKHSLSVMVSGLSLVYHPVLIEKLVSWGVSVIVAPATNSQQIYTQIMDAEKRLLENKLLDRKY